MPDRSPLNDPHLEALAEQLAAARPRLGAKERDALLYECGFAAGRQSAARIARRWRAVAASLALVAAGLGVVSTSDRTPPQIVQVVVGPERATEEVTAEPAGSGSSRERPRPGVLLASSSWEQVRASMESPPHTVEVFVVPEARSRRAVLSVGSAWSDPELSK